MTHSLWLALIVFLCFLEQTLAICRAIYMEQLPISPIDVCFSNSYSYSMKYSCRDNAGYAYTYTNSYCGGTSSFSMDVSVLFPGNATLTAQCSADDLCDYVTLRIYLDCADDSQYSDYNLVTNECVPVPSTSAAYNKMKSIMHFCTEALYGSINYVGTDCTGRIYNHSIIYQHDVCDTDTNMNVRISRCTNPWTLPLDSATTTEPGEESDIDPNCYDVSFQSFSCEWYLQCLERKYQCGDDGYPVAFAYYFCNKYVSGIDEFALDHVGRDWVYWYNLCMQSNLVQFLDGHNECEYITNYAYSKHGECFLQPNNYNSLCYLNQHDYDAISHIVHASINNASSDVFNRFYWQFVTEIKRECQRDIIDFHRLVFNNSYKELYNIGIDIMQSGWLLFKEAIKRLADKKWKDHNIQIPDDVLDADIRDLLDLIYLTNVTEGSIVIDFMTVSNSSSASKQVQSLLNGSIGTVFAIKSMSMKILDSEYMGNINDWWNAAESDDTHSTIFTRGSALNTVLVMAGIVVVCIIGCAVWLWTMKAKQLKKAPNTKSYERVKVENDTI